MSELWRPQPNKHPDVTNLFDMMLVFQEAIDAEELEQDKLRQAALATKALAVCFSEFTADDPTVSVVAELAVFERSVDPEQGLLTPHVGLRGRIDSVRGLEIAGFVPFGVSLGMDVESIFPLNNPSENDIVLCRAKVPINRVQSISKLAS